MGLLDLRVHLGEVEVPGAEEEVADLPELGQEFAVAREVDLARTSAADV